MASRRGPRTSILAGTSGPIDLGKLGGEHAVTMRVAPIESTEDAAHRRWKDKVLLSVSLGVLAVLFIGSLVVLAIPSARTDLGEFAQAVLTGIMGLLGGYALGKRED